MPLLDQFSLAGRVAILYTSGGDEAQYLVLALAQAGAKVFVVARRDELLEAALSLVDRSDGHSGIAMSLESADAVAGSLTAFRRLHDRVEILVNDARSQFAKPAGDISLAEWTELQSRNLLAPFLLCQSVGRWMISRQYGRIVNIISGLAERGVANGSAYSVSQAGLLALTRSLAVEWGSHNLRVNAIGVGWTTSEDVPVEEQLKEQLVRYIPLRHKGHPRDIGPLLAYLCSEACDYTTGQPVYVDGGLNAHP